MEYLDFELPIKELEDQLDKCQIIGQESDVDVSNTCKQIEKKLEETKKKISVGVCKAINGTDYKAKYLYTCSQCGVEFDAKRKKTEKSTFCSRDCLWKSQAVDKVEKPKKYQWLKNAVSKECLFRLYWIEMKSTTEIGKMLGVSSSTVILNMEKLGIPRRPRNHK